jgi:GPH family glycoside/pentoside/hexuronide:cation symporter/probable glucitol transport protein GutA
MAVQDKVTLDQAAIPPLKLRSKISYALGETGCSLSWTMVSTYWAVFLTDMVGIPIVTVSLFMLIVKVWDGINDPICGGIMERTRSKHGRFRPYLLYGAPILAVASVLCFSTPFHGAVLKVVWAVVTYLLLDIVYGFVSMSQGALSTVMSYDPKERTELQSWRMIGTNLFGVASGLMTMPLILRLSGGDKPAAMGYTLTTIIYSVACVPLLLTLFFNSREVVKPVNERKVPVGETIKNVLSNKPLWCVFFMLFLELICLFGRLGVALYYYIYVLKRFDLIGPLMALPSLVTSVTMFILKGFVVKIGPKRMILIGIIISGLSLFGIYMIDPVNSIPALMVLTMLYAAGTGFFIPPVMAMVPEAIDYQEDKTGVRSDGSSYSCSSLATKISAAVGASIGLLIMAAFGYVANAEQTPEALKGINIATNLYPLGALVLFLIPFFLYPLNPEKNAAIRARLEKKGIEKRDAPELRDMMS